MSEGGIPTIDIEDFPAQMGKLREACEKWGCFRLVNHKIPLTLMSEMKQVVRSLLDLPLELKKRNADVITGSGYMAPSQKNPLYEALGLYDLASSEAVDSFCSQLNASDHQREIIKVYAKAVHGVGMEIAGKLAESLGIISSSGESEEIFRDWACQFRINKYNFTPETVGLSGVQMHTDSGFLTILQDDENNGGLEVMDNSTGEFLSVEPLPGSLVVNLGDMAAVWSNGRVSNVKHRVQCKKGEVRASIASFVLGPKEAAVEAPTQLVDSEHPRLYAPVTYEGYRNLRLSAKLHAGEALLLIRNKSESIHDNNGHGL